MHCYLSADPLDNRYLYQKQSLFFPEAGESNFAKEDIPQGKPKAYDQKL